MSKEPPRAELDQWLEAQLEDAPPLSADQQFRLRQVLSLKFETLTATTSTATEPVQQTWGNRPELRLLPHLHIVDDGEPLLDIAAEERKEGYAR